jgi:predicted metal-binding membrane protein
MLAERSAESYPLARERNLIRVVLLVLAAAGWAVVAWQTSASRGGMAMAMGDGRMELTMGMEAPLFLAMWVAMMVAMMFPTATPMILVFHRIQASRRKRSQQYIPTSIFVASYLLVWSMFGAVAFFAASMVGELAHRVPFVDEQAARIGGFVLIAAGLYQLSGLKRACLSKCRSPIGFLISSWRDGWSGALRMGISHGAYCLGCCWLLFVILFPLGVMNIAAMLAITVLIFAEKSLSFGERAASLAAVTLVAYGVVVLVLPYALPTMRAS